MDVHKGNIIAEEKCPFCRAKECVGDKGLIDRLTKRIEINNDANAMHVLGYYYLYGCRGLSKDETKTYELWHKAGELGCALSNLCIANMESDERKSKHYYEVAAIEGNAKARHNLGILEVRY